MCQLISAEVLCAYNGIIQEVGLAKHRPFHGGMLWRVSLVECLNFRRVFQGCW